MRFIWAAMAAISIVLSILLGDDVFITVAMGCVIMSRLSDTKQ